ncbi:MAG: site-specific DNA-methyltransferase [Desulfovibrio sp.]|jgi:adenine-specific DNA-methyltransferase|nr:site-specific DNA-methyltransferase [Desulfovibrio sp.]
MQRRLIEDPQLNMFQRENGKMHKPTSVAPVSILSHNDHNISYDKFEKTLDTLKSKIGMPFFASDNFILYNTDAEKFLDSLNNINFELDITITSPPYNIGKEYEEIIDNNDYVNWCKGWMSGIHSATSQNGAFWLNLGYFDVVNKGKCVPISYLLWDKSDFYLQQEVVWMYEAGVTAKKRFAPRNEKWLFYVKNPLEYTFNLDSIRDPNVKYPNQKKNGKFRCNPLGKNPGDVWNFPKVTTGTNRSSKERTEHPAQFPLKVIERIILACSNTDEIVFDPFAGSCSTGIASAGLNRLFIGTEINIDYCKLAVDRFKKFKDEKSKYTQQSSLLHLIDGE